MGPIWGHEGDVTGGTQPSLTSMRPGWHVSATERPVMADMLTPADGGKR